MHPTASITFVVRKDFVSEKSPTKLFTECGKSENIEIATALPLLCNFSCTFGPLLFLQFCLLVQFHLLLFLKMVSTTNEICIWRLVNLPLVLCII